MFRASRRLCFEDTKRIMSPETRPKSFGTFEKRAPGVLRGYLAALMVRNSLEGELCMRKHNTMRAVLLDVVPERRTKRCSPRFRPGDRFCEASFRYLLPGSEGGKCRPLDQRKQIPFIHSVRLISSDNFYIYIYRTLFFLFPPCGAFKCVVVWCDVMWCDVMWIWQSRMRFYRIIYCKVVTNYLSCYVPYGTCRCSLHLRMHSCWTNECLLSRASLTCICCVLKWNIKQKEECFIKYPNTEN